MGLDESGQGFEDDGDAQGDEEDGVEESAEDLSADKAVGVLVGGFFLRHVDRPQTNNQGDDVVQHVESIGHEREGMNHEPGYQLDQEEGDVDS